MSQIPEHESPLADQSFVNVGEQNWYALRSEWREVAGDSEKDERMIDYNNIDMNQVMKLLKGNDKCRIPLAIAVSQLNIIWAESTL